MQQQQSTDIKSQTESSLTSYQPLSTYLHSSNEIVLFFHLQLQSSKQLSLPPPPAHNLSQRCSYKNNFITNSQNTFCYYVYWSKIVFVFFV